MKKSPVLFISAFLCLAFMLTSCLMPPPPGSPETGYSLYGFIGLDSMTPAVGQSITLVNKESGAQVGGATSDALGRYTITGLPSGHYIVQAGKVKREVILSNANQRMDINLSAAGGVMDYSKNVQPQSGTQSTAPGGTQGGPNNPQLMQQIAGIWWGYSGSTERKIALCPDGTYQDYRESGYSGRSTDQYGDETLAWGSASQGGGSGRWSIQGNTQQGTISIQYNDGSSASVGYRQSGESGCLLFNGSQLCRTSASCR